MKSLVVINDDDNVIIYILYCNEIFNKPCSGYCDVIVGVKYEHEYECFHINLSSRTTTCCFYASLPLPNRISGARPQSPYHYKAGGAKR